MQFFDGMWAEGMKMVQAHILWIAVMLLVWQGSERNSWTGI
jgi:hypothetical protein